MHVPRFTPLEHAVHKTIFARLLARRVALRAAAKLLPKRVRTLATKHVCECAGRFLPSVYRVENEAFEMMMLRKVRKFVDTVDVDEWCQKYMGPGKCVWPVRDFATDQSMRMIGFPPAPACDVRLVGGFEEHVSLVERCVQRARGSIAIATCYFKADEAHFIRLLTELLPAAATSEAFGCACYSTPPRARRHRALQRLGASEQVRVRGEISRQVPGLLRRHAEESHRRVPAGLVPRGLLPGDRADRGIRGEVAREALHRGRRLRRNRRLQPLPDGADAEERLRRRRQRRRREGDRRPVQRDVARADRGEARDGLRSETERAAAAGFVERPSPSRTPRPPSSTSPRDGAHLAEIRLEARQPDVPARMARARRALPPRAVPPGPRG